MSILKANDIRKVFGGGEHFAETVALNNVDFSLDAGEFVAVMGPSGSGKSTLLNILSGFDYPTSGHVIIKDTDITSMGRDQLAVFRRTHIGYVFQEYHLLNSLTIKENIMLPLILEKKTELEEMSRRAEELMLLFGVSEVKDKYPYNISGGQQQRAAICRALINNASILFADEPTGSLDSRSARTVLECFEKVNQMNGITILMVTHDPYAASYSDRILFIKDGKIRTQLYKKDSKQNFYQEILDHLSALEEKAYDI